jgi:hypothetical protein
MLVGYIQVVGRFVEQEVARCGIVFILPDLRQFCHRLIV